MKPVYVEAVGVAAPGLPDWQQAGAVLRGDAPYVAAEMSVYQPDLLPPNERRRATAAVRLAFRAAEDAMKMSAHKPGELAAVFATSESDTGILHRLCTALAQEVRAVSPTDFHNSVHNAAAGYWSIATAAKLPSSSISAYDATFAAGLLEGAALAHGDGLDVLLVCYDIRPPEPLHAARPLVAACASALVLAPQRNPRALARLEISACSDVESELDEAGLEHLRTGNPAARALPLLRLLALGAAGAVVIAGTGGQRWQLRVTPP